MLLLRTERPPRGAVFKVGSGKSRVDKDNVGISRSKRFQKPGAHLVGQVKLFAYVRTPA